MKVNFSVIMYFCCTFPIEEPVDDIDTLAGENFHIVEEHDQFITVSAADMKTADELQFIEKLQTPKMVSSSRIYIVCNAYANLCFFILEYFRFQNCGLLYEMFEEIYQGFCIAGTC